MTEDPWASVENMLRWKIALARSRVSENLDKLPKVGELYPLPKVKPGEHPHGQPEQWAFGKLTVNDVALRNAMSGLGWAAHEINKAEESLSAGDLPTAIHLIIAAHQSISSTMSRWSSASGIAMWRYVGKMRKRKAMVARLPRGKVSDGSETIGEIIRTLAHSKEHLEEGAKELWPHFYSQLDCRGLNPNEEEHQTDLNKCRISYDFADRRKSITFGQFSNRVSTFRLGKKSG